MIDQTLKIGVAGCGRMGQPMLAALRASGFAARGFDIRPPASYGAFAPAMTDDPKTFGQDLKVLISVVRDAPQTDMVLFGDRGMIEQAPGLGYVVLSSTLSPRYVRALRDRVPGHIKLIDAPMSGAVVGAETQSLSFMLGGAEPDIAYLRPLFEAMGSSLHPMGAYGQGAQAKVLNNLLAASHTAMTRLVLDWADAAGLDERRLLGLVASSSGQNWLASGMETIEFARDGWEDDNTIAILTKDIEAALDAAPSGADTGLPEAIHRTIRALKPRKAPTSA